MIKICPLCHCRCCHWRCRKLFIFFFRTTGPVSTKLGTKYPWVKGIHIYSNEGPRPFQGEVITKLQKYIDEILKIFYSRTTRSISTKFGTKHSWVMKTQVCSNEGPCPYPRVDNYKIAKIMGFFSSFLNQHYDNHMCLLIWTVFSGERCGPWASLLGHAISILFFGEFEC